MIGINYAMCVSAVRFVGSKELSTYWKGEIEGVGFSELISFCPDAKLDMGGVVVPTNEGLREVCYGDYVVKLPTGQFFVVRSKEFNVLFKDTV